MLPVVLRCLARWIRPSCWTAGGTWLGLWPLTTGNWDAIDTKLFSFTPPLLGHTFNCQRVRIGERTTLRSNAPSGPRYQLGYRQRDDRCEGVYIRNVASGMLDIVSFTAHFADFDLQSATAVPLIWYSASPAAVHVRVVSLRDRLYYRMDTLRPESTDSYLWPTDILSALRLANNELGVLAWTTQQIGNDSRRVYLPVAVGRSAISPTEPYQLLLLPERELREVFLTLAPLRSDGSMDTPLVNGQRIRSGYLPAGRPVPVDMPALPVSGLYYLELGARLREGGAATVEMWFYHHPDRNRGTPP